MIGNVGKDVSQTGFRIEAAEFRRADQAILVALQHNDEEVAFSRIRESATQEFGCGIQISIAETFKSEVGTTWTEVGRGPMAVGRATLFAARQRYDLAG
jgi:hypothetical protein